MNQSPNSLFGRRLCGVLVVALLIFASLMPPKLEQLRTGHWEIEHFLAYLAAVPILYLGWPRPFLIAAALVPTAALLEALQCLQPDHSPNSLAALSSMGGAAVGAALTSFIGSRLSPRKPRHVD
jgi:VanZ family protein